MSWDPEQQAMQTMPQIGRIKTCLALLATIVLMAACGKGTDSGKVFVPATGHTANWASPLAIGTQDFHATIVTSAAPGQSAGNGAALFIRHCAPCHSNTASGKVGPNILAILQFSTDIPANITGTINGVPLMQGQAVLSQEEIRDIAGYLSSLIGGAAPVPEARDTTLCSQCHGANLDSGIARISCFACHNGPEGNIGHPSGWLTATNDPVGFHGTYGRNFVAGCTTCHGLDLKGSIVFASGAGFAPACSSCHNGVVAPIL
jgi:mono/diheme cytochrome c family protein